MKRESLQTPLLPDPFARLLGSECSLHCCSQTLQSPNPSPPLQRHKPQRGGEEVEAWAAAAARDAAAADADARAGAADGRNHHRADPKGASFVPTSPLFLFRFLAPVRVRRPRFLGGFFWGAKDLISFFIFARPPRMVLGLPAFDSIRGGLGS